MLRRHASGNRGDLPFRAQPGNAGLQPPDGLQKYRAAVLHPLPIGTERRPDIRASWKLEAVGHHTQNDMSDSVEANRGPDDRRIGPEALAPQMAANDDNRRRADELVAIGEGAAQSGPDAQHAEEVA